MGTPMSFISPQARIYSSLLSSRYSFNELYDQDISLIEDMDFYRILMSDAGFGAVIRVFYAEIAASGVMVQPGNRDIESAQKARIVAGILKKAPMVETIWGLSKGFIMGRAYAYPEGRGVFASHDKTEPQNWWTPVDIKDIDKRRVMLKPERVEYQDPQDPQGLPKKKIVVHRHLSDPADNGTYKRMSKEYAAALIEFVSGDEEERLGMGRGLAEALYLLLRAKAMIWKFKLQGLSRWAESLLVGTVDPDRPASPSKNNLSLAQDLLNKLRNMRDGNVIVVPEGLADVKAIETNGVGDDMTQRALDYCDDCAAKLLLGALKPTGGNKGAGTEAGGRVEADTTKRIIQSCRYFITACLNRTLVRTVCRLNRAQFAEVGCLGGEDPELKIVDNQATDPETVLDRIEKAQKMKMKVPKAWAHEVSEIPIPSEDEEVLEEVEVAGLTGMGGTDFSGDNDGKEKPGGDGTPFQKTGERQDEEKKGEDYAARRDSEIRELIGTYEARIERLERNLSQQPVQPVQPAQVVVNVPPHHDAAAAKEREEILQKQILDQASSYAAERERPIEVHVAAPVVNVAAPIVNIEKPDPVVVNVAAAPSPVVNVEVKVPSPAPPVVNNVLAPNLARRIKIMRDKNGQIDVAEIETSK